MMLFTACSSEDIEKGTDVPKNASQIKFSFTEEDFDSDEELTRAAKSEDATQAVKDFGNNLEVEYGLERDPDHSAQDKKAATRAIANAHYTIRAYQGTTLKDEMRGTFNGNTFTPDADSKDVMGLAAGTYDFIAFNDKVTPTATGFTVTQANVATAFIGKAKAVPISGKEMKLAFWMKHVGCRVRVKVNRYAKKSSLKAVLWVNSIQRQMFLRQLPSTIWVKILSSQLHGLSLYLIIILLAMFLINLNRMLKRVMNGFIQLRPNGNIFYQVRS